MRKSSNATYKTKRHLQVAYGFLQETVAIQFVNAVNNKGLKCCE